MKQRLSLFLLLTLSLWAADFWQTKPYTEWTDKDTQRMLSSSPWAHEVELMMGGGPSAPTGGPGGGRGRGGPEGDVAPPATMNFMVRWRTALPMKQALARLKFGKEVANSAEAKTFLDHEETTYMIGISGLPAVMMAGPEEQWKNALKSVTALSVKGKGLLAPSEVQITPNNKTIDVTFSFPRTAPLSLDDKEVEFSTRIGPMAVQSKFRLKDMVVNGKLEL